MLKVGEYVATNNGMGIIIKKEKMGIIIKKEKRITEKCFRYCIKLEHFDLIKDIMPEVDRSLHERNGGLYYFKNEIRSCGCKLIDITPESLTRFSWPNEIFIHRGN